MNATWYQWKSVTPVAPPACGPLWHQLIHPFHFEVTFAGHWVLAS
jgi:hypothetical protein